MHASRYDNLGRRHDVVYTGTAFANDHLFKFGYTVPGDQTGLDRGELNTANRYLGTDPDDPGDPMTPGDYDYRYDTIGNRSLHRVDNDGSRRWYCPDELNRYLRTDDEDTCAGQTPTETLAYDDDGNLTADGTYTYVWDSENRLIEVQTRLDLGNDPDDPDEGDKKLEFKYDYMSRRVEKTYSTWDDYNWAVQSKLRFVYDDWNVVMVLDGANDNATARKYTWGLDLSGLGGSATASGIHGAGGIGGLLAVEETAATGSPSYWFMYDANGNVGQALKASDQSIAARYEYDPYGNVISSSGDYADANPIRFSTKWFDSETGLYYYGYRYYLPRLGRWLNRDPIGEGAGSNLCSFSGNSAVNSVDPNGQHVLAVGVAPILASITWGATARELAAYEEELYREFGLYCVVPYEAGSNNLEYLYYPTGFEVGGLLFPDWAGAVAKIDSAVQGYVAYYQHVKEEGGCSCPEFLHIIGYSDGATSLAMWLDRGAHRTALKDENPYGLIALNDMVRLGKPDGGFWGDSVNLDDAAYHYVPRGIGRVGRSFSNATDWIALFGPGWSGYRITGPWNHMAYQRGDNHHHLQMGNLRAVVDQLKKDMWDAMNQLKDTCWCD